MPKLNRGSAFGTFFMIAMLIVGIGTGWYFRQNTWEKELMEAVEEIAIQNGTLYVDEFNGVVGIEFPEPTLETNKELLRDLPFFGM